MFQKNKKLIIIAAIIVVVFVAILLFGKSTEENKEQQLPSSETEEILVVDSSEDAEQKAENVQEEVIVQGSGGEEQNGSNQELTNESVEENDGDSEQNEFEDDYVEEITDSGVDRFKDGPYAYITIEDLCKHGKKLQGFNIYTVGEVVNISDGVLYINAKEEGEPVVAYIYEDVDVKVGESIAFYGFVIDSANNGEQGNVFIESTVLGVGDEANVYREAETDESFLPLF